MEKQKEQGNAVLNSKIDAIIIRTPGYTLFLEIIFVKTMLRLGKE